MKKLSTELAIKEADKVALNSEKVKRTGVKFSEDRKRAAESKAKNKERPHKKGRGRSNRGRGESKGRRDTRRKIRR